MRQHAWKPLLLALALSPLGCEVPPEAVAPSPEAAAIDAPPQTDADPVMQAVQEHTAMLAAAQRNTIAPDATSRPVANEVMWLAPGTPGNTEDAPQDAAPPPVVAAPPVISANTATVVAADPAAAVTPPPQAADVMQALYQKLDAAGESDLDRALRSVGVSLVDPQHTDLDEHYLTALSPEQQQSVRLYHDLVSTLYRQLVADGGRLDRDAVTARLDALFGQQPISIRDLRLCRRVNGYGVYEPFESTTFVAGHEQRMIVYVELEDFAALDRGDGQYLVDLQQEVALYSADGLAVWRSEPVRLNDTSANRRRDFFVVQLVTLPDRLSLGRYRLKVRITDMNGGSIDERGVDLDIVADRAMVEKPPQESAPLR